MADMNDLERHRWKKDRNPNNHDPLTALKALVEEIEAGNISATHIFVCIDNQADDAVHIRQAGRLDFLGTLGLIERAKFIMME